MEIIEQAWIIEKAWIFEKKTWRLSNKHVLLNKHGDVR